MSTEFSRYQFDEEKRREHKVNLISGSDEVGRGAMAGPIVVASVVLDPNWKNNEVKDSKLLTANQRERLFSLIINSSLAYTIKEYDNHFVDLHNPKQTSIIGICETIYDLKIKPELSLIDGEKIILNGSYKSLTIIKGDNLSQSIACASILAKVYRDKLMVAYRQVYQNYGFEKHKGYCTKEHVANLHKYGILPIHRKSYQPVKILLEENNEDQR